MNDKELEKFVKNSINIDFKDISNELLKYQYQSQNKKPKILKYCMCLCSIVLIISIYFINKINYKEQMNILKLNKIDYKYNNLILYEQNNNNLVTSISLDKLTEIFNYNLNISNINQILCTYENENLKQCNILYNFNEATIYINMSKGTLPTFINEPIDSWDKNINNDLEYSVINDFSLIIIENLNEENFIDRYRNKNTNNYQTKFMLNNIGFSIESYGLDFKTFISYVEKIIS